MRPSGRARAAALTIATILAVSGLTAAAEVTNAAAPKRCEQIILTSHQGAHTDGDGNTIPAYVGAVERGAEAIEMDVRRTKDGQFVMFHNAFLQGSSTGRGFIKNLTLRQIQRFRTARSRNRIPSLNQTFDALASLPVSMELELKDPEQWPRSALVGVVAMVRARHLANRVTLKSLDIPTIRRIHQRWPGMRDLWKSVHANVNPAEAARFTDGVVLNFRSLTRRKVKAVHAAGLTAYSPRLRAPAGWSQAVDSGVDTVMTTTLRAYQDWCAARR